MCKKPGEIQLLAFDVRSTRGGDQFDVRSTLEETVGVRSTLEEETNLTYVQQLEETILTFIEQLEASKRDRI